VVPYRKSGSPDETIYSKQARLQKSCFGNPNLCEERKGENLPTYTRYKIRYLRVLRHLHMHTHISAHDFRETVQSDSPRNSQTKNLISKREKREGPHLYVESNTYASKRILFLNTRHKGDDSRRGIQIRTDF